MARSHRLTPLALAAALSIALAGCGGGATPTSAPTPTPAPTPTAAPTPVDVAGEVLARLLAARTGVLALSGMMTVGGVDVPISGSIAIAGSDSQSTTTLELPGGRQTTGSIRVGTAKWSRSGDGPWVADPEPADRSKSLSAFLETLTSLEDRGVATKAGRALHRLAPPASVTISPDALGFTDPGILDPTITMEFWAEDDGTPAFWSFAISWNQASGATSIPVALAMDLDLSGLGRTATVEAPEDPWEQFTSARFGYSMAHPPGWTVSEQEDVDSYLVDGTPYVTVAPQALKGYTLERFLTELISSYEDQLKTKPETNVEYVLAGQPARFMTYHFTNDDGVEVYVADAVTVAGGTAWEVFLTEQAGSEAEDTPVFEAMLSTFDLTE
jgi:hypothetical protein